MALPRAFYRRSVLNVARDLLGMKLIRVLEDGSRLEGTIVEVEAYDGERDRASHASRGLTRRTEPMFGEPGHAYVYLIYGMHHCMNVVTGPAGHAAAVLIRAVEPRAGVEWMEQRRTVVKGSRARRADRRPGGPVPSRIASGPGLLTRAFGVDLSLNRVDLCSEGPLIIEPGERISAGRIVRGERIGVEYAGAWALRPWRFGIRDHPALSRPFTKRSGETPREGSRRT